jgi:DNA-binding MurR/RpiR family transcriptional regulator
MFHDRIRMAYEHLSPSYRKIADFLLKSYDEAAFMGASDLADHLNLDPATVVRFSQRLGYAGYPELLRSIQAQVKVELRSAYAVDASDESVGGRFQQLVRQDSGNLEQVLAHNPPTILEQAVNALRSAQRIQVLAEGHAASLGESFARELRQSGLPAQFTAGDLAHQATSLAHIGADSAIFGISVDEYAIDVAAVMRYARDEGASTIGCVGSLASPLARSVEILLFAPAVSAGPYPSLTAATSVINALLQIAGKRDPETLAAASLRQQRAYLRLTEERERQAASLRE